MERENKPRRPRISTSKEAAGRDGNTGKYEKINFSSNEGNYSQDYPRKPRINNGNNYNSRPQQYGDRNYSNNDRSYNNNNDRGYNNGERNYNSGDRNYNNGDRGYNSRPSYNNNNNRSGGYGDNRQRNYNNTQNDYNNRYANESGEGENYRRPYNKPEFGNNRPVQNNNRRPYNNSNDNNRRPFNSGGNNNRRPFNNNNNNNRRPFNNNTGSRPTPTFVPTKRIEYVDPTMNMAEPIRLNKFLANAGICSRREADAFIEAGAVKVNGAVVNELGSKISRTDEVTFQDKPVSLEHKVYVLLNKPKDCVTTSDDPQGRLTVMDIVRNACSERIYPVGRLDRNTTGVLLLTNDGDLASKLTHPKFVKKKIYHVWADKNVTEEDMQRIADGIELEDGPIHADAVSYATEEDYNQVGIEIHSGRNRIVRRIFESLGYRVTRLDRVYFAGLTKKNLPRGRWRYLTQQEVNMLKMGSFE